MPARWYCRTCWLGRDDNGGGAGRDDGDLYHDRRFCRAVAYADIIQSTIKILGCGLMLIIGLYKVGGWHGLLLKVPEAMTHIHKPYTTRTIRSGE